MLSGGTVLGSINGYFTSNLGTIKGIAIMVIGIVTLVYAAFGLRKYLSGDGRGDQELVKVIVGVVISMALLAGGMAAFFGINK